MKNSQFAISDFDDLGNEKTGIIPKKPSCKVKLLSYAFEERVSKKTKTEYKAIVFYFLEPSTNNIFDLVLQEPKQYSECKDEKEVKLVNATLTKLKKLFSAFTSNEVKSSELGVAWDGNYTWEDLYNAFVTVMPTTEVLEKLEIFLKICYPKGGRYTSIPLYGDFISTKLKPKEFQWNPQYDFIESQDNSPQAESEISNWG